MTATASCSNLWVLRRRLPVLHCIGVLLATCYLGRALSASATQVNVQVERIQSAQPPPKSSPELDQSVVIWLAPLSGMVPPPRPRHFQLVQKDKQFRPRLLIVPTGSVVDFPNEDPFYHNVFSFFNGKRFDLGLYEEGSTRAVHFDHSGVSYIFCNIHPQMHAVVIALATPYVAVASAAGTVSLPDVPPGDYELKVWSEGATPEQLESLSREVHVSTANTSLGVLRLPAAVEAPPHLNKYGEPYTVPEPPPY